jgi:hypothetical protein
VENIVLIFVSESDSFSFVVGKQKKLTCNHTEKDLFLDFPNKKATDAHNK